MIVLKRYFTLCRAVIALFAACSATTGFFLAPGHRNVDALVMFLGTFLLACGASALNQFQERGIDAKMERTRSRPLPSGSVSPSHALAIALMLMIVGLALLGAGGSITAPVLGLVAVLCYNGIYTGLKRVTAFASVPGAVVGMVPPAIGWTSAGAPLSDPRLWAVSFLFFLWQVPHFWLLLLDYDEEYQKAGLPSVGRIMSKQQIARVTSTWVLAASVATLLLPLYGSLRSLLYWPLLGLAAWLAWNGRGLAAPRPLVRPLPLFRKVNVYLFAVMSLLVLENIFFNAP